MKYSLVVQPTFLKAAKQLGKRYPSFVDDLVRFREDLLAQPEQGVDLGGGLRKIRMRIRSKGRGKSGGARVIAYTAIVAMEESTIHLLFLYDKADRSTVSKKDLEILLEECGLK